MIAVLGLLQYALRELILLLFIFTESAEFWLSFVHGRQLCQRNSRRLSEIRRRYVFAIGLMRRYDFLHLIQSGILTMLIKTNSERNIYLGRGISFNKICNSKRLCYGKSYCIHSRWVRAILVYRLGRCGWLIVHILWIQTRIWVRRDQNANSKRWKF